MECVGCSNWKDRRKRFEVLIQSELKPKEDKNDFKNRQDEIFDRHLGRLKRSNVGDDSGPASE